MNEQEWRTKVKEHDGVLVVWVDQSTDTLLKHVNSNGVCFAMAWDFVTAYQMGSPAPFNFVNGIRDTALAPPTTNRVPAKYLEIQDAARVILDKYKATIRTFRQQLKQAEKEKRATVVSEIKAMLTARQKVRYGPGMESVEKYDFTGSGAGAFIDIFEVMQKEAKKGPRYFLLGMRKTGGGGGHAVGFGFRPDLSGSDKFPQIYEFFDANLGLFVFGNEMGMDTFFTIEVMTSVYMMKDYEVFELASFPVR